MFAGHIGAALAIGRAERRTNVGTFVAAAVFLDAVLWLFVLLGWESVSIPADFASTHQARFVFPYSHSLFAAVAWSALAGGIAWSRCGDKARWRFAALFAAAVFSHWLLDALVHAPELPLLGDRSAKVGLALWNDMPLALGAEGVITALGLWLFLSGAEIPRGRKIAMVVLCAFLFVFTAVGMTVAPPPPSITVMPVSSLLTLAVVCAIVYWLDRR